MIETKNGRWLPHGSAVPVTATSGSLLGGWGDLTPTAPLLGHDRECSPKPGGEGFISPLSWHAPLPGVSRRPGGLVVTHRILATSDHHPASLWVATNGALPPSHMQTCALPSVSKVGSPWARCAGEHPLQGGSWEPVETCHLFAEDPGLAGSGVRGSVDHLQGSRPLCPPHISFNNKLWEQPVFPEQLPAAQCLPNLSTPKSSPNTRFPALSWQSASSLSGIREGTGWGWGPF